jgi:hypothetical protein
VVTSSTARGTSARVMIVGMRSAGFTDGAQYSSRRAAESH